MRRILLSSVCAAAAAAALACGGGSSTASKAPLTVAGCITEVDGNYMLTPGAAGGPVGTSGREQKRYKLLDDSSVGVGRYVNRQAQLTGRPGETQSDGTTVLHVTQLTGGAECAGK